MQQIERVGVIALLLLVVTMATVALWGDGKPTGAAGEPIATAQEARASHRVLPTRSSTRGQRQSLPLNATPARNLPARQERSASPDRTRASSAVFGQGPNRDAELSAYAKAQKLTSPERPLSVSRKRKATSRATLLPQAAVESTHEYIICRGDNLGRIARVECGDSKMVKRIMALNGITNPDRIREGQVLMLPGAGTRAPTARAASHRAAPSSRTYVVKPGDSLSAISQRTLGTSKRWEELMALNEISDPTKIRVGQVLNLPGGGLGATAPVLLASVRVGR
jgi:nucleoid-associated protein YgaU